MKTDRRDGVTLARYTGLESQTRQELIRLLLRCVVGAETDHAWEIPMGSVYILRSGTSDLFKIGRTHHSVARRIKQLNTGNPAALSTFDVIESDDAAACEAYLHQTLRTKKHFGKGGHEFFQVSPRVMKREIADARKFLARYTELRDTVDQLAAEESEERTIDAPGSIRSDFKRLLEIRELQDSLKYEREMLEFQIKVAMGAASTMAGVATWKSITSERFDLKTFQRVHSDLFAQFKVQSRHRRFSIVSN